MLIADSLSGAIYKCLMGMMVTLLFIVVVTTSTSAQDNADLTEEEQAWITEHPVLKASSNTVAAPFDFVSLGEPTGFSIEYLNLIGTKVGLRFEYVNHPTFSKTLEAAKNKEIDILHTFSKSEERAKYFNFSASYYYSPIVNFGRVGSQRISSIGDLKGKRIGVIKDALAAETYKQNHPHFILIEFNDITEAVKALSLNKIDVYTGNFASISFYVTRNNIRDLEVLGNDYVLENSLIDQRFAVHKDNSILMAIVNKGMALVTDEEYKAISEKWLGVTNISSDIGLTREEINWLSSNNIIRAVADPTSSPIEFIDPDGQIRGYAGDYLNLISNKLNIKFGWIGNQTLSEGISIVKAGGADLMAAVTESPERNKYLNFSSSYLTTSSVIFANKENANFINLQSLSGHTLAQVEGFSVTELLRNDYPDINIITVDSMLKALQMVNDGDADAYVGIILSTSAIISSNDLLQVGVVGDTPYQALIRIATRKELPLLSSSIEKALNSITEVERAEIANKWAALQVEEVQNYDLLWKFGGSALIILALILLWNNKLRNEILLRKKAEDKAESALAEAKNANAAKSIFLANMSHELRTPLNAIIGFSEAMMMGVGGKIATLKHREYIKNIKKSGDHLVVVINDVLDLSKIEADKWILSEKEFLLTEAIKGVIKMLTPQAALKKIKLGLEGEKTVTLFGDEHAFKRIIINLLSNSIKFTPENGKVRCVVTELNNGSLKVEIIDNGFGIPKEGLDQVLNPFEQSQEGNELKNEGTGLGLPIVKKLIEMHDGEFILTSELGVGTCAAFIIPADRAKIQQ